MLRENPLFGGLLAKLLENGLVIVYINALIIMCVWMAKITFLFVQALGANVVYVRRGDTASVQQYLVGVLFILLARPLQDFASSLA